MHEFLSNLANRQTDRQTNTGKNIYLLDPLSGVINRVNPYNETLHSQCNRTSSSDLVENRRPNGWDKDRDLPSQLGEGLAPSLEHFFVKNGPFWCTIKQLF